MPEKRNDLIVVEVLIAIIVPLLVWGGMGGIGMMCYGGGAMMLVSIIFIILLMIGVFFLLSMMTGSRGTEASPQNRALEALKEWYVKGDITKVQYLVMKEALGA